MGETQRDDVLRVLGTVIDPDLRRDIVSLGFIKDLEISGAGDVTFKVELTTPACPIKDKFQQQCRSLVAGLPWVQRVKVVMTARKTPRVDLQNTGLRDVTSILAVSSCKGGVGKSTVALNLAHALRTLGARVGLVDLDVFGPSLPTLANVKDPSLSITKAGKMLPIEHEGLMLMSHGFVKAHNNDTSASIMRGPMVSTVVNQLLMSTEWGDLDYLLVDMPPGTGDVQLTLCQLVPLTASLIITTPQQLSFTDVVKGIQMFDKLKVPVVGVVENMSYFICDGCVKKHYPFGKGAKDRLIEQFGIVNGFELPIDAELSSRGGGHASQYEALFQEMAAETVKAMSRLRFDGGALAQVRHEPTQNILEIVIGDETLTVDCAAVRRACRCAACVHEFTGEPLLQPSDVNESVAPTDIQPLGNYAVAIYWDDGHTSSVYPFDSLVKLAGRMEVGAGPKSTTVTERSAPASEQTAGRDHLKNAPAPPAPQSSDAGSQPYGNFGYAPGTRVSDEDDFGSLNAQFFAKSYGRLLEGLESLQ